MRPGIRRALVAGVAVLLVFAGLAAALRAVLQSLESGALRERVRLAAEDGLDGALARLGIDARVRVGALEGALVPTLVLRDVRVEAEDATPIRIGRLSARVDLLALLARRAVLDDVRVEGLAVALTRERAAGDPAPRWTWQRLRREPPPPGEPGWWDDFAPTTLELRALTAPGATLALRFPQDDVPSALDLEADASVAGLVIRLGESARDAPDSPVPWPASASLAVRVSPGRVGGRSLEAASATLSLAGSRLRLREASLHSTFGRARLTGEADLAGWLARDEEATAALEGEVERLDLGVLLDRSELAGGVSVRGTVSVAHAAGASLAAARIRADLALGASQVGTLRLDSGRLVGRYTEGAYALEEARLEGPFGRAHAAGEGERDRIGSLSVDAAIRDLAALDAVAPLVGRPPWGLAGEASLVADLSGTWARPAGSAALEATRLRAAGLDLGHVSLRAESPDGSALVLAPVVVRGGTIALEALEPVRLRREGDRITIESLRLRGPRDAVASVSGHVDPRGVEELQIELPDLDLAPFAPLLGPDRSLGGRATLRLVANGALPRPALSGELVWSRPRIDRFVGERLEARIVAEGGTARAEGVLHAGGRALLQATARAPWRADVEIGQAFTGGAAELDLVGDSVDLALLEPFLAPDVRRIEGRADLRLAIRGGAARPTVGGSLVLAGAHFDVASLGQRLGPLDGRVAIETNALHGELTLLGDGGSRAHLSGSVALDGLRPGDADLRLVAEDLPVRYQTSLRFRLSAEIDATGPLGALYARGQARLDDLRFFLRPGSDPLLREISVIEPGETPLLVRGELPVREPSAGGPWDAASVDVAILVPRDSRVVGQGANVEIEGELRAAKAPSRPLGLYGTLHTVGGSYRAQGRIFTITPSKVTFEGRPQPDPTLDLRAEGSAGGVKILVRVQGRASDPVIRLESEPPYPERDILALLLFGRTRDQLGRNEAGALQSFLAQTGGGAAIQSLNAFLGPTLRVDTIEATPSERGEGGTIGVGRWVTDEVFVQYGQGYGDARGSEVRMNWRLAPRWSLESRYSAQEGSSADVIWTYDY